MDSKAVIFNYISPKDVRYKLRPALFIVGVLLIIVYFSIIRSGYLIIPGSILIISGLYLYIDDKGYSKNAYKSILQLESVDEIDKSACELASELEKDEGATYLLTENFIFVKGVGTALRYEDIEALDNYKDGVNPLFYSYHNSYDSIRVIANNRKYYLTGENTPYSDFPKIIERLKEKREDLFIKKQ